MLTQLQQQKLTHYFNILDFNRSGTLEKTDFESIGENLSILWGLKEGSDDYEACIHRCAQTWMDFRDFIGKPDYASASLNEWLQFADKIIVNGSEDLYQRHVNKLVREIFDFFDVNKDGYISLNEYIDLFMAYRIEIRFSAKSFTKLDVNKDDMISREEMLHAVREFFRSDDKNAPGNWLFGFWDLNPRN